MSSEKFTLSSDAAPVEYREIAEWPGYRVGNDGSVWSRRNRGGRGGKSRLRLGDIWRKATPFPDKDGYLSVNLSCDGKMRKRLVARLVLEAFVGPCPAGMESCHFDGNPANNRADNLRWDTHQKNAADRIHHGTQQRGSKCWNAQLNESQVLEVRKRLASKETQESIAKRFNVSRAIISFIAIGKTWAHAT